MHFTTVLSLLAIVSSVRAQPVEAPAPPTTPHDYLAPQVPEVAVHGLHVRHLTPQQQGPMKVGRRLSRKHNKRLLEERHWHHHHHSQSSTVDNGNGNGQGIMTIYTTITTNLPTSTDSTTDTPTDTATDSPSPTDTTEPTSTDSEEPTSTSSDDTPTPSSSNGINPPQITTGAVIQATGSPCGDPNGVPDPAPTSGPNGDENWLNCGVDTDGGWQPPPVTLQNLIYRNLSDVLETTGNPFEACRPYLSMFETMESETGVPTIFLASIALQESGCNPTVTGGATEVGIMQITPDKCPSDGSDCYDPMTNIRIGSEYFKTVLDSNDGNLAATMGNYNGWQPGLTVAAANDYSTCAQHNNLDYLQNVFNGYLQGVSPDQIGMGIYHNTC